ncbi:5-(carboxyamino)imidazole ribonucleotide synthase [Rhizosaccharibacter radicis]|uniref:N5-carboxyaminoimidazole ribonucleotide synthase n=1 Tax=Rhizosaccharibacter radicis TaxID=2782605 RepID=A0ABT1VWE4_9PROT|nr:5-(carboxyamino)imidazole ribonucleotide synthase [Acetobacteraceae bacterium KSS12]
MPTLRRPDEPAIPLPPGSTIGIVGGGQLGRMSALAAARLGYRCHVLTDDPTGPAAQVSAGATVGGYDDPATLAAFADAVDVITFEFENVSADGLELLTRLRPVRPHAGILRLSQDRVAEKHFLSGIGIPVAPWHPVEDEASLQAAAVAVGLPLVLKTTRLGYDGKGQRVVREASGLTDAFAALEPHPLVAEAMVSFASELSVMVARGLDGTVRCFDAAENRHRAGILDLSLAPAPIGAEIAAAARAMAVRIAEALDLVGILGVEMFLDRDGTLLVNEIAPRPHNSGHWTMDACPVGQFEMHVRAVAGLPLPEATRHSDAVMKNLVGPDELALWPVLLETPGLLPHHYGKAEARPGRKMGHVNRLFPRGALPGPFGIDAALGPLAGR